MALKEGTERTEEFRVEGPLLTDVDGTLPMAVLSTPGMIEMMEYAATRLVADDLPPEHATVGFEVCVKHVGGALEGALCTVTARLREVIEERKLRFDVEVREGVRTIGVGTHERRVIPVTR
jgi:predicted thioesterase